MTTKLFSDVADIGAAIFFAALIFRIVVKVLAEALKDARDIWKGELRDEEKREDGQAQTQAG